MSGHSKWSTIKRKKGVADAARGRLFTKLTNTITVAAQSGGDPTANPTLRMAIEKARSFNVPRDNIDKAIKRGTGEIEGIVLESFSYDAVGPGGLALIIEGVTDNKNRTLPEIRLILTRHQGKMAQSGSQQWQFDKRGLIELSLTGTTDEKKDEIELTAIDSGATDVTRSADTLKVYTDPGSTKEVADKLEEAGLKPLSIEQVYVPNNPLKIDKAVAEKVDELIGELEDHDDVQNIFTNKS